jgi:DNA gyrase/topoisomerase IV subunit B
LHDASDTLWSCTHNQFSSHWLWQTHSFTGGARAETQFVVSANALQVRRQVDQVVTDQLGAWLDAHPAALSSIVSKALTAARAAEAARKARELVRRKSSLTSSTLPGKLADCTSKDK